MCLALRTLVWMIRKFGVPAGVVRNALLQTEISRSVWVSMPKDRRFKKRFMRVF